MARLWAKTVDFDTISAGDQLPVLVKWETADTIRRFVESLSLEGMDGEDGPWDTTPIPGLIAYATELLEKAFPVERVSAEGSSLELELLSPVRANDTISISGRVADKREESGLRLVECQIVIEREELARFDEPDEGEQPAPQEERAADKTVAIVRAVVSL